MNSHGFVSEGVKVISADVVVLGAGITGLVSASVLLRQGYKHIVIVDEFDHVGGNHIDWSTGDYTFDAGSFIFQDDSPLLGHFPELLPLYVPIEPSWGKLNPQGAVTSYPISIRKEVIDAGVLEWVRMAGSVLKARLFHGSVNNAREFARYWIGDRLLVRSGLENYLERFFGVPAERVDIKFAQKRMMWIREHAMVSTWLKRLIKPSIAHPTNRQLARPKEGFAHLYDAAVERLKAQGVTFLLGASMKGIQREDERFRLELPDAAIDCGRVISTIPIGRAQELCAIAAPDKQLETVTLVSLFFSFDGKRGFDQSILYNFSYLGAWKRLTVYSDFYGRAHGREYFAVEVIGDQVNHSIAAAEQDFRRHVGANGLLDGDLKLEGGMIVPGAYPIYTDNAAERAARAIEGLQAFGLESFGRQGGFNYQPTARVSTVEAEAALACRQPRNSITSPD